MTAPVQPTKRSDIRRIMAIGAVCLVLTACSKSDKQADALDRAATQSDPAAAAELRNKADAIRDRGDASNVAEPHSAAQNALQSAGNAAAADPASAARPGSRAVDPQTGLTR